MPRVALPPQDSNAETHWLGKFANLNAEPDRGRGVAPHKALLLFCVLDLVDSGTWFGDSLSMSAELVFRFETYWAFVYDRRQTRPDIRMPFHALGSRFDRLWQCHTEEGHLSMARL